MIKKVLLSAIFAASLAGMAIPASAANTYIRVAPPQPRAEAVPESRHGHLWVPGYWKWRGQRHVWVAGTWVRERPGYRYDAPRWEERDGRWYMQRGRWARGDRDGDGVPNRYDRHPNDPRRN